jgi:hypothetical protein
MGATVLSRVALDLYDIYSVDYWPQSQVETDLAAGFELVREYTRQWREVRKLSRGR